MRRSLLGLSALGICLVGLPLSVKALEVNEKLSIEANLTGVYQWLKEEQGGFHDEEKGSVALDARVSFKPTEVDEFSARASFAKGNGLNKVLERKEIFKLRPSSDDLRDDLHNINNRSRDHLLELWYARTFSLPGNSTLKSTLGILDGTAFIDQNRFANDELTQFMNEAFVNNPLANIISYDYGVAFEFGKGPFGITLLGMTSKTEEHDDPRFNKKNYNYYSAQISYKLESPLGEGNYRVYGFTTNKRFPDWNDAKKKALKGFGVSIDQDLIKDKLGLFARVGFQDDDAKVDYKSMYSAGLTYKFCLFGKKDFTLGAGYAFLKAPSKNDELKQTKVFETYFSIPIYEKEKLFTSHLTFDWQWMKDKFREEDKKDHSGHIFGVRLNLGF